METKTKLVVGLSLLRQSGVLMEEQGVEVPLESGSRLRMWQPEYRTVLYSTLTHEEKYAFQGFADLHLIVIPTESLPGSPVSSVTLDYKAVRQVERLPQFRSVRSRNRCDRRWL